MYNISSYEINDKNLIINIPARGEDLTTWGIFISSILLSSGACISQVLSQIQKSKCKNIKCWGLGCDRDLEQD
tara:strand:- start:3422 stop:3640 length:219 start_codon:yes stop_codon:yes gene_type:complete